MRDVSKFHGLRVDPIVWHFYRGESFASAGLGVELAVVCHKKLAAECGVVIGLLSFISSTRKVKK